ncbi:COP9 signalosome complex subunit 1b [Eumeta japonica]|uniref:COP9 signalosome complex subunit 1b n=1 Tax=Eumeta variegata TaxID=151549 RepID=A0A4C1SLQ8_EUMVA|nr:COP9 signalosome complex subunit 1b [Eumeta japonica]
MPQIPLPQHRGWGAAGSLPDIAAKPALPAQSQDFCRFSIKLGRNQKQKAALKLEKLDSDLKNFKSSSIKENWSHVLSYVSRPSTPDFSEFKKTQTRNRALIQYLVHTLSADMRKMATAFNHYCRALENEVMQLILMDKFKLVLTRTTKYCTQKKLINVAVLLKELFNGQGISKTLSHSLPRESGNHVTDLCVAAGSSTPTTARI